MPIQVVCPGCKTRFNVGEKFAGQRGPCPKCKAIITIPKESAPEVKIHESQDDAPKDSKGRAILKPIARKDTTISGMSWVMIACGTLVTVSAAFAVRYVFRDGSAPAWLIGAGLALVSPPLAVGGYSILKNDEMETFEKGPLWLRAGICGLIYAAMWSAFLFVPTAYLAENVWAWLFLAVPGLCIGGLAALATLDLEFGNGVFHYAFYLIATILLRWIAGLGWIWEAAQSTPGVGS